MSTSDLVSCVLYHGPSAQGRAAEAASAWGRVIGNFSEPRVGLNVDKVREAVAAMSSPPVGDRRGSVVVGPVDVLTQEGVIDVLLKTLEEFDPRSTRPYLWAWDVGSVRPTIRSRCLVEWCPGQVVLDRDVVEAARSVVEAALSGSTAGVIEGLADLDWKSDGADFLQAVAQVLARRPGHEHLKLWGLVRPLVTRRDTPTSHEVLAGFLP